ncbi:MAG: hypothetical protein IPK33_10985 [Gemmatimonadetes bacterium]|jgi:hypothetical protein|nr:hypothetical protein [Gemmatimonadota bacterium]
MMTPFCPENHMSLGDVPQIAQSSQPRRLEIACQSRPSNRRMVPSVPAAYTSFAPKPKTSSSVSLVGLGIGSQDVPS